MVFVITIISKEHNHGLDIVIHLLRVYIFSYLDAQSRSRANATSHVNVKGPIGFGMEACIFNEGMAGCIMSIINSNLKLTRKLKIFEHRQDFVIACMDIRSDVESFLWIYAVQRGRTKVRNSIPARTTAKDVMIKTFLKERNDSFPIETMHLNRLTDGKANML